MESIVIAIRLDRNVYLARVKGEDVEWQGTSPDEAIGWLVRERIISHGPFILADILNEYD